MAKRKARDPAKEAAWRRRLGRHAGSGQSVRSWCRRHGVTEAGFHWWRRELARRDAEQSSSVRRDAEQQRLARRDAEQQRLARRDAEARAGSFVPVHVAEDPARATSFLPVHVTKDAERGNDPQIEIVLTDGRRVRITGAVHQEVLARVLNVLTTMSAVEGERGPC